MKGTNGAVAIVASSGVLLSVGLVTNFLHENMPPR